MAESPQCCLLASFNALMLTRPLGSLNSGGTATVKILRSSACAVDSEVVSATIPRGWLVFKLGKSRGHSATADSQEVIIPVVDLSLDR